MQCHVTWVVINCMKPKHEQIFQGLFLLTGISIGAWISNYITVRQWDEIRGLSWWGMCCWHLSMSVSSHLALIIKGYLQLGCITINNLLIISRSKMNREHLQSALPCYHVNLKASITTDATPSHITYRAYDFAEPISETPTRIKVPISKQL